MEHGSASWSVIGSSIGCVPNYAYTVYSSLTVRSARLRVHRAFKNVPQALGPRLHATGGVNVQYTHSWSIRVRLRKRVLHRWLRTDSRWKALSNAIRFPMAPNGYLTIFLG